MIFFGSVGTMFLDYSLKPICVIPVLFMSLVSLWRGYYAAELEIVPKFYFSYHSKFVLVMYIFLFLAEAALL
jgi:hypothetical protein